MTDVYRFAVKRAFFSEIFFFSSCCLWGVIKERIGDKLNDLANGVKTEV
jgi:hypothetical protein